MLLMCLFLLVMPPLPLFQLVNATSASAANITLSSILGVSGGKEFPFGLLKCTNNYFTESFLNKHCG